MAEESSKLTLKDKISFGISLVGVLGIGLVFVQINQASEGLENSVTTEMFDYVQELNKLFLDHPELWPYFNDGEPIEKGDPSYYKALAAADYHLDLIDAIWMQSHFIEDFQEDQAAWDDWFSSMFSASPILCVRLDQAKKWYSDEYYQTFHPMCQ